MSNWYKIKYIASWAAMPQAIYTEIFKASDPDDLLDKWHKFAKDHSYEITDVELLERGQPEKEPWFLDVKDSDGRAVRLTVIDKECLDEPTGAKSSPVGFLPEDADSVFNSNSGLGGKALK